MQKKIVKKLFVSQIIVSELVPLNCLYQEGNTCLKQSMFSQTVLRFFIPLRETFSNSIALSEINKYGKGATIKIVRVFWPVY